MTSKCPTSSTSRIIDDSDSSISSLHEDPDAIQAATEVDDPPGVIGDLVKTTSNIVTRVVSRISTRTWPEPPPPPDGGLKAWTQVAMAFFALFTAWGYANSFGAYQTYYTDTLPESPSTISWIGGIQTFLTLTIGAFSGRFSDAGFFIPTFIIGVILQVVGIFLMSFSTQYWQLLVTQGVICGLGSGIYFTPAVSLVNTYFDKHRAVAIGLVTTGNSVGGIVYPLIVRDLIPKLGFAWTTRVIGFLNLGVLSLAAAFLRPRLPPRKSGPLLELGAFKEPVYAGYVISSFFLYWANYYTFYYIGSYGREVLGLSYSSATVLVIIINGVGIPFRVLVPMMADRIGNINIMVPVSLVWAIVSFIWLVVDDVRGYYAFTVVYGIAAASFQCLFPSTVARITPQLDTIGTRLGMAFSVSAIASLTGPPLGGAIQGWTKWGYRGAQIWAGSVMILAFVLFIALRLHITGLNLRVKC